MHSDKSTIPQGLLAGSEEPSTELLSSIPILHLFVIFQIVSDNESRAASVPLPASNFLFSASSNDSKLMTIDALHYDVGLLISDEALDLEVADQVLIVAELVGDIIEMLDG